MPRTRKKTVGDAMLEVRELHERAAVHEVLSNYLRTRYIARDSMAAQAKINCLGSPVSEAMVEECAQELEEGAKEMKKVAKAYEQTEIDG